MPGVMAGTPFTKTTLWFTPADSYVTDPITGNPKLVPGEPVKLVALVAPDRAKQLHLQPGADVVLIPVRGELVDPLTFPPGCGLGSALTLTWAGVASTLKIGSVTENDLPVVAFGTYFEGEITPGGPGG